MIDFQTYKLLLTHSECWLRSDGTLLSICSFHLQPSCVRPGLRSPFKFDYSPHSSFCLCVNFSHRLPHVANYRMAPPPPVPFSPGKPHAVPFVSLGASEGHPSSKFRFWVVSWMFQFFQFSLFSISLSLPSLITKLHISHLFQSQLFRKHDLVSHAFMCAKQSALRRSLPSMQTPVVDLTGCSVDDTAEELRGGRARRLMVLTILTEFVPSTTGAATK